MDLQREGWRDAWFSPPGVDDWTWCRASSTARYDRVFLHDAGDGESAECAEIRRLTGVWPALSDHVALHAVVRRRSKVQVVPEEASSLATRQAALASSSSASGPAASSSSATGQRARASSSAASGPAAASSPATHQAAPSPSSSATGPAATPSPATGQAARAQRQSASAHAAQAPAAHAGTVPVVAIGNAIVQCAKAARDAGLLGVEEAGDAGELPKWNEVPKDCEFKIERPGGRGHQHHATTKE